MAVTKIRKVSSLVLLILMLCSIAVLGLFYGGGYVDPNAEMPEPIYTSELLYWAYVVAAATFAVTIIFAIIKFIGTLVSKPMQAIKQLAVLVVFAGVMFAGYAIGDGTPLNIVGYDGPDNTAFWLKMGDMFFYTIYLLICLVVLAVVGGKIFKSIGK